MNWHPDVPYEVRCSHCYDGEFYINPVGQINLNPSYDCPFCHGTNRDPIPIVEFELDFSYTPYTTEL
jgi:hypothetical protein